MQATMNYQGEVVIPKTRSMDHIIVLELTETSTLYSVLKEYCDTADNSELAIKRKVFVSQLMKALVDA